MDYLGKWAPILTLDELVYPHLVRLFYANLVTLNHPFRISSKVMDIYIEFNDNIFQEIFGIHSNNYDI